MPEILPRGVRVSGAGETRGTEAARRGVVSGRRAPDAYRGRPRGEPQEQAAHLLPDRRPRQGEGSSAASRRGDRGGERGGRAVAVLRARPGRQPDRDRAKVIVDIDALKRLLPDRARLLGLDLGEKTIGLALSDTQLTVATPMETLKRGKFSA